MLAALLPLFGGGLAAGLPDLSSLPPPPSSLVNLSSRSLANLSSVSGAAALLPWLDGLDLDEWDGQGGLDGLMSGRNASCSYDNVTIGSALLGE